jgi:hypothetical protein
MFYKELGRSRSLDLFTGQASACAPPPHPTASAPRRDKRAAPPQPSGSRSVYKNHPTKIR